MSVDVWCIMYLLSVQKNNNNKYVVHIYSYFFFLTYYMVYYLSIMCLIEGTFKLNGWEFRFIFFFIWEMGLMITDYLIDLYTWNMCRQYVISYEKN